VVVIFFLTYGFAIVGVYVVVAELQAQYLEENQSVEDVTRLSELLILTAGVDKFMFLLIQVLVQDSFFHHLREIGYYLSWSWVFFFSYITVGCFVLMNLVTAIIVENAREVAANDHDHMLRAKVEREMKEIKELKKLFEMMDADGSGTLCWDEFSASFDDPHMHKRWMLLDYSPDQCQELFKLLDDGDGEIETDEFFDGIQKMKGPALAKDVFRLQKTSDRLFCVVAELFMENNWRSTDTGGKQGKDMMSTLTSGSIAGNLANLALGSRPRKGSLSTDDASTSAAHPTRSRKGSLVSSDDALALVRMCRRRSVVSSGSVGPITSEGEICPSIESIHLTVAESECDRHI